MAGPATPEAAPPEEAPASDQPRPPGDGREKTPVLVVDDDPQTLRYVRNVLSDAGYAPLVTGRSGRALRASSAPRSPGWCSSTSCSPERTGSELMKRVPELADLPVIFISGYGRDETIAKALESGAADYIVKPFSPTELVARVQAALRNRAVPETFVHGDLAVDYGRRRVSVAGREVPLTATEFDLLRILSLNGGRVVTTEALLRQVWGRRGSGDTDRRPHRRQEAPPQARRQRRQSHLHLQRARRRLPLRDPERGLGGRAGACTRAGVPPLSSSRPLVSMLSARTSWGSPSRRRTVRSKIAGFRCLERP